jgi:hypothetical protein
MAEQERRPIFLSVHQVTSSEYPRFRISDQYLRYWTGEDWSHDESKGLMYANSNEACTEVQRLLMLEYMQLPHKKYRASVYVDLWCDHEVPEKAIKRWLHCVSKLLVDAPAHGNGPVEGSLGLVTILWSELGEITGKGRA